MRLFVIFGLGTGLGACFMLLAIHSGALRPKVLTLEEMDGSVHEYDRSVTTSNAVTHFNEPESNPGTHSRHDKKTVIHSKEPALSKEVRLQSPSSPAPQPKPSPPQPNVLDQTHQSGRGQEPKTEVQYPDWWQHGWPRSAVSTVDSFAGDRPLFPECAPFSRHSTAGAVPFIKPETYLASSKNPCWYDQPRSERGLRCLPYVYLAGVAKCGTTDIARRLRMHPDVYEGTSKEYHWWERSRFDKISFPNYLKQITGDEILEQEIELKTKGSSVKIFGDYSPSYMWDPRHWQELEGNQGCSEPRVIHAQHMRHIYPAAKIILTFRHPTPRLYSRFLSRIPRTPELKSATSKDFHKWVVDGVKQYKQCFKRWSVRHCAYNETLYRDVTVRIVEGMYAVFMADWLRVWPRGQMFIMRYEDYGGHEGERLSELIDFLGLAPLNSSTMDQLLEKDVFNSGSEEYQKYGSMLPETRAVLDDFYQPFVNMFATLLGDRRFLWLDVEH